MPAENPIPVESWKQVVGFEGLYEVSDCGLVRRALDAPTAWRSCISTWPGKILSPCLNTSGYPSVCLRNGKKQAKLEVHRLVAAAFLGPKPPSTEINHKDGDKTNNRVSNLEYVTHYENMIHAQEMNLFRPKEIGRGMANGNARLTDDDVRAIRLLRGKATKREVAEQFGISIHNVCAIWRRVSWRHIE